MNFEERYDAIIDCIEENIDKNSTYIKDIAAEVMGINPQNFEKIFKFMTDISFAEYVAHRRIARILRVKEDTGKTWEELAGDWGYADYTSLYRTIKSKTGLSPVELEETTAVSSLIPILHMSKINDKYDSTAKQFRVYPDFTYTEADVDYDYLEECRKKYNLSIDEIVELNRICHGDMTIDDCFNEFERIDKLIKIEICEYYGIRYDSEGNRLHNHGEYIDKIKSIPGAPLNKCRGLIYINQKKVYIDLKGYIVDGIRRLLKLEEFKEIYEGVFEAELYSWTGELVYTLSDVVVVKDNEDSCFWDDLQIHEIRNEIEVDSASNCDESLVEHPSITEHFKSEDLYGEPDYLFRGYQDIKPTNFKEKYNKIIGLIEINLDQPEKVIIESVSEYFNTNSRTIKDVLRYMLDMRFSEYLKLRRTSKAVTIRNNDKTLFSYAARIVGLSEPVLLEYIDKYSDYIPVNPLYYAEIMMREIVEEYKIAEEKKLNKYEKYSKILSRADGFEFELPQIVIWYVKCYIENLDFDKYVTEMKESWYMCDDDSDTETNALLYGHDVMVEDYYDEWGATNEYYE